MVDVLVNVRGMGVKARVEINVEMKVIVAVSVVTTCSVIMEVSMTVLAGTVTETNFVSV